MVTAKKISWYTDSIRHGVSDDLSRVAYQTDTLASLLMVCESIDYPQQMKDDFELFMLWFWRDFALLSDVTIGFIESERDKSIIIHTRHRRTSASIDAPLSGGFETEFYDDGSIYMIGSTYLDGTAVPPRHIGNSFADFPFLYWKKFINNLRVNTLNRIRN